jgi:hypothetical protein
MHRLLSVVLLLGVVAATGACSKEEKRPILVEAGRISVINMTGTQWTDVEVWLNDHYRVQADRLAAGQRLDIPIGVFIAGFGQRFDPKKQAPFGVEVSAKGADGQPVIVTWGKGRRR